MDRQGVMRGKCNCCDECEEYIPPKEGARCDYCNHTPVDHVKIIKLGACKTCGEECEEYLSAKTNCYTECQYCGCAAVLHEGAEKLRKPAKSRSSAGPQSAAGGTPGASPAASGTCKYPGCTRVRYTDQATGKQHEFCGRTCARNYQSLQQTGMPMAPPGSITSGSGPTYSQSSSTVTTTSSSHPGGGLGLSPFGSKPCSKCGQKPANPGYKWCQTCYIASKGGSTQDSSASVCSAS